MILSKRERGVALIDDLSSRFDGTTHTIARATSYITYIPHTHTHTYTCILRDGGSSASSKRVFDSRNVARGMYQGAQFVVEFGSVVKVDALMKLSRVCENEIAKFAHPTAAGDEITHRTRRLRKRKGKGKRNERRKYS